MAKKITKKFIKEQVAGLVDRYFTRGVDFRTSKNKYEQAMLDVIWDEDVLISGKTELYRLFFEKLGMGTKKVSNKKEGQCVTVDGKKIIVRYLDPTQKYKVVGSSLWEATICQNCGRVIKNAIHVENEDGVMFLVGTECIHTVVLFDNNETMKLAKERKEMNALMSARTKLRKLNKTTGIVFRKDNERIFMWEGKEYNEDDMHWSNCMWGRLDSKNVIKMVSEFISIDEIEVLKR